MFSENIKTLRLERKLSQADIAKKLGITQQAYSLYETGLKIPSFAMVLNIADFFGVSIDSLVNRDKSVRNCRI